MIWLRGESHRGSPDSMEGTLPPLVLALGEVRNRCSRNAECPRPFRNGTWGEYILSGRDCRTWCGSYTSSRPVRPGSIGTVGRPEETCPDQEHAQTKAAAEARRKTGRSGSARRVAEDSPNSTNGIHASGEVSTPISQERPRRCVVFSTSWSRNYERPAHFESTPSSPVSI